MSDPKTDDKNLVRGAMMEAGGAISSLHMFSEPITPGPNTVGYLCDIDRWAKHAVEHMYAVQDYLRRMPKHYEALADVMAHAREDETGNYVIPGRIMRNVAHLVFTKEESS